MIARKYGVVYTPDRLADFAAELLCAEIEKSEFDSVNVLDPACGECALLDSVKKIKRNEYEYIGIDVDKSAILSASSEYTIINNDTILPKNVRKRTAEFWTGKLPTINAVIANPPWSSEKIYNRDDLRKAGYELTAGQYDSFVLFLELAYKIVCENGIFAFIIPDSIFDSQNENLRRFLIRNTEIKVIARLGEKLFDEVNRATTIIVCKKRKPNEQSITKCFRLSTNDRKRYLLSDIKLIDIYKENVHQVLQRRFLENPSCNFDVDTRREEENLIAKIKSSSITWEDKFNFGRGVEISKSGKVVFCSKCGCAQGYKKSQFEKGEKTCTYCGEKIIVSDKTIKSVISKQSLGNDNLIYVGENVKRYGIEGGCYIKTAVPGINYKNLKMYTPPKLLIRKTGLGIYASIDYTGSMTSQTVYILKLKDREDNTPFIMPYNMAKNHFKLTSVVGNIGEAVGDWRYNKKYYERIQGIVMDTRYLMYHYSGKPIKEKVALAECIEAVLGRDEITSTGETPIPKPVSYVGINSVDSMVAEDSGSYNLD